MKMLKNPPKYNIIPYLSVQIKSDEYENIIYHYSNIEVNKESDIENTVPLSYSYNIISGTINDSSRKNFDEVVASILFDIIQNLEKQQKGQSND